MPTATAQRIDPSSARHRPTLTRVEGFALTGPSGLPDPTYNAYRKDLADIALAGQVLASHYAEPVARVAVDGGVIRSAPSEDADALAQLAPGECFALLEESVGWAWGYAESDHRVGYVSADVLSPIS